ncbi:MAG: hypothetical protein WC328_02940 [Kiritimatiellia bacterium]|nr:hypothetical protein [Kiritimatiellia bacterium]
MLAIMTSLSVLNGIAEDKTNITEPQPCQSWACIGETQEEVLKKCGEPKWIPFFDFATVGEYRNGEPHCRCYFYTNKVGKSVLGSTEYFCRESKTLTEPQINQILKVNSAGKEWKVIKGTGTEPDSYFRDGASALYWHHNDVSRFEVLHTDYQDYCHELIDKRMADIKAAEKK